MGKKIVGSYCLPPGKEDAAMQRIAAKNIIAFASEELPVHHADEDEPPEPLIVDSSEEEDEVDLILPEEILVFD